MATSNGNGAAAPVSAASAQIPSLPFHGVTDELYTRAGHEEPALLVNPDAGAMAILAAVRSRVACAHDVAAALSMLAEQPVSNACYSVRAFLEHADILFDRLAELLVKQAEGASHG